MTRRDRAALLLAYECMRCPDAHDEHGDPAAGPMLLALDLGGVVAWQLLAVRWYGEPWAVEARLERARYALTMRALLRADAGDYGALRCPLCGSPGTVAFGQCFAGAHAIVGLGRRIDAMWSLAPAAGTATRPLGLRRRGEA